MLPMRLLKASGSQASAAFASLAVAAPELGVHLTRMVLAEVLANGVLQGLVVWGVGIADSPWLALLPLDAVFGVLRACLRRRDGLSVATTAGRRLMSARVVSAPSSTPTVPPMKRTSTKGTAMFHMRHRHHHIESERRAATRRLALPLALIVGLIIGAAPAAVAAPGTRLQASAAAPTTYRQHVERADNALARATRQIRRGRDDRATDSLTAVRRHVKKANTLAKSLIGAPPTDPESDDAPGPPAVMSATKLDHRVTTAAVALLDAQTKPSLVGALGRTVRVAQNRRDGVLDAVIALPAEGDGVDYSDGMADTLGQYGREVQTISSALNTFTLSSAATTSLTSALGRAQATQMKMEAAFGGGE